MKSVLIANRGEIAVRVARAARDHGIKSIAIYSDEDRNALHVALADEAYALHGLSAAETYLDQNKIIEIAKKAGADAADHQLEAAAAVQAAVVRIRLHRRQAGRHAVVAWHHDLAAVDLDCHGDTDDRPALSRAVELLVVSGPPLAQLGERHRDQDLVGADCSREVVDEEVGGSHVTAALGAGNGHGGVQRERSRSTMYLKYSTWPPW